MDRGGTDNSNCVEGFRFAKHYVPYELVDNPMERRRFFEDVLRWEGCFIRFGIGIAEGGLTFDGVHIKDGAQLVARTHSNPSKEALHIALLALVVGCEGLPRALLPVELALEQLERKASALDAYRASFPGLHGFMPWFDAGAGGAPLQPQLAPRYNGMLAWALYLAVRTLEEAGQKALSARLGAHLDEMRRWAVPLTYKGRGKIAASVTLPPRHGPPVQSDQNCDDPFAGELFSFFLDLLGDWGELGDCERSHIWSDPDRHSWLHTGVLDLAEEGFEASEPLEALFHGTFSAHEEWKHLLLPYRAVPVSRRLLLAAERIRCKYASKHALPGLLGDCHVSEERVTSGLTQHVTTFGIPRVSSLRAEAARRDAVAASGALGLLVADPAAGAAWLHATLSANTDMQTPWGMAESCSADGAVCCPLLTWDAKATIALAILGGTGDRMQRYLQRDGLWQRFVAIIEDLYAEFALRPLLGELAELPLPAAAASARSCAAVEESGPVNLELVRACRGVELSAGDARQLHSVHEWFMCHQTMAATAAYCLPYGWEDWWCSAAGCRYGADALGQERLYLHVVEMFKLGIPLVLLARQPPAYPLYFDLDIYGGSENEEDLDRVHRIAWESDEQLFGRSIAFAILRLYPQFVKGLELAVFSSSGFSESNQRYKASYHLVFPQIIVDRPVKPWKDGPPEETKGVLGRHMNVRDHVVCCLNDQSMEDGRLSSLHGELLHCCDQVVEEGPEDSSQEGQRLDEGSATEDPVRYLNDWSEILDDKPLRHEPWPDAFTGMRLPFTDKVVDGILEGRPKVPLGRWRIRAEQAEDHELHGVLMEQLPDLEPAAWVRLGDIAGSNATILTPWEPRALHPGVDLELG